MELDPPPVTFVLDALIFSTVEWSSDFLIEINPSETFTISEKFKIIFASTLTESESSPGEDELKVGATISWVVKFRLFLSDIPAKELLEPSSNAVESIST